MYRTDTAFGRTAQIWLRYQLQARFDSWQPGQTCHGSTNLFISRPSHRSLLIAAYLVRQKRWTNPALCLYTHNHVAIAHQLPHQGTNSTPIPRLHHHPMLATMTRPLHCLSFYVVLPSFSNSGGSWVLREDTPRGPPRVKTTLGGSVGVGGVGTTA